MKINVTSTKNLVEVIQTKTPHIQFIHISTPYPKAFTDRFGTCLFADQVSSGIRDVIEDIKGLVHIVGDKKIYMFDLAKMTTPDIKPMTLKDYSGPPLTIDISLILKDGRNTN